MPRAELLIFPFWTSHFFVWTPGLNHTVLLVTLNEYNYGPHYSRTELSVHETTLHSKTEDLECLRL